MATHDGAGLRSNLRYSAWSLSRSGGASSFFDGWARHLTDDAEALEGHVDAERVFAEMMELRRAFHEWRENQPRPPYEERTAERAEHWGRLV